MRFRRVSVCVLHVLMVSNIFSSRTHTTCLRLKRASIKFHVVSERVTKSVVSTRGRLYHGPPGKAIKSGDSVHGKQ